MKNGDTQSRQRQPPGSLASETIRNKRPPGADISFSISRAPIGDSLPIPPLFSPSGNLSSAKPLALFFSVIFPTAHLSLLNETGEADGAGVLLFFGRSSPLSLSFFFVTERRMQKREGSSRASLETSSPAVPPRAITLPHGISPFVRWWRWWSVPLCSTLRCTDTFLSPPSSSTTIGRCIYAPVCFAFMIHRVFCFKCLLRSRTYTSINLIKNSMRYLMFTIYTPKKQIVLCSLNIKQKIFDDILNNLYDMLTINISDI